VNITNSQLKRIVLEETKKVLLEQEGLPERGEGYPNFNLDKAYIKKSPTGIEIVTDDVYMIYPKEHEGTVLSLYDRKRLDPDSFPQFQGVKDFIRSKDPEAAEVTGRTSSEGEEQMADPAVGAAAGQAAPAPAAAVGAEKTLDDVARGKTWLKWGDKGKGVEDLQNMIINYRNDPRAVGPRGDDADYGNNTYNAVRLLQKDLGVAVDGAYGQKTHKAFQEKLAHPVWDSEPGTPKSSYVSPETIEPSESEEIEQLRQSIERTSKYSKGAPQRKSVETLIGKELSRKRVPGQILINLLNKYEERNLEESLINESTYNRWQKLIKG
jgi:peptidoglycan hydrolase-like protein with peptidoglycan-binding domain